MCIYIYIYAHIYTYIHIYVYTHMVYTGARQPLPRRGSRRGEQGEAEGARLFCQYHHFTTTIAIVSVFALFTITRRIGIALITNILTIIIINHRSTACATS